MTIQLHCCLSPPTVFPPLPTHYRISFMSYSKQHFQPRAGVRNGLLKGGCSLTQNRKMKIARPAIQEIFVMHVFYENSANPVARNKTQNHYKYAICTLLSFAASLITTTTTKSTSQALQSCDNLQTKADTQTKQMRFPQSSRIAHPHFLMDLIHKYQDLFPHSILPPLLHVPAPPPCFRTPLHATTDLKYHVTSCGAGQGKTTPQQTRSYVQVACQQTPHGFET